MVCFAPVAGADLRRLDFSSQWTSEAAPVLDYRNDRSVATLGGPPLMSHVKKNRGLLKGVPELLSC
jgi:hypothetical protein